MFGTAERIEEDAGYVSTFSDSQASVKKVAQDRGLSNIEEYAGRYGESRRTQWHVILGVLLLHAVLIAALVQVRQQYVRHKEARLVVLNLTPPPPPPAAEEASPPKATPAPSAPPPLIVTPSAASPVVAAPVALPIAPPRPATPIVAAAPPGPPPVAAPPAVVQSNDLSTRMISAKPPRYPIESRRKKEQGTVVLALTLGLDGRVLVVAVARSSGFARLDDAAKDAVRNWRWAPTLQDGQPVIVRGRVEIPFVLQG